MFDFFLDFFWRLWLRAESDPIPEDGDGDGAGHRPIGG